MTNYEAYRFKDGSDAPIGEHRLTRRYAVGSGVVYDRPILKPISGVVTLKGGGSVDYDTGVVMGGEDGNWRGEHEVTVVIERKD